MKLLLILTVLIFWYGDGIFVVLANCSGNLTATTNDCDNSIENYLVRNLLTPTERRLLTLMKVENAPIAFNLTEDDLLYTPTYDEDLEEYVTTPTMPTKIVMDEAVQFVLYTSSDPLEEKQVYIGELADLLKKGYQSDAPTKIICHGFMSNYLEGPGNLLKPAYFQSAGNGSMNIILVNWAAMAGIHRIVPKGRGWTEIFYFPPARNTEIVGNKTARFIEFLVQEAGTPLHKIHLVGHSLGAHAMGYAGRNLEIPGQVARLTALDPAGPCFESHRILCFSGTYRAVSKDDAVFVDAIHTHARALGMKVPIGQADFYPNGGFSQPGCSWTSFGMCSHRRAIEFMAESINQPPFEYLARKCTSWDTFVDGFCRATEFALLGEHCSKKSRGVYFLATRDNEKVTTRNSFIY